MKEEKVDIVTTSSEIQTVTSEEDRFTFLCKYIKSEFRVNKNCTLCWGRGIIYWRRSPDSQSYLRPCTCVRNEK